MSAAFIITTVGIILLSIALVSAIWQLVKCMKSRRKADSATSSPLESGTHRRDSALPQPPVHSGFEPQVSGAKTHLRNKSETFRRDPRDKTLPADPELAARVAREYNWRWSWLGRQESAPPSPIAKDDDPNYEIIGLAR